MSGGVNLRFPPSPGCGRHLPSSSASQRSRFGHPALTQSSSSTTRHRVRRPIRTARGIRPLQFNLWIVLREIPRRWAAPLESTRKGRSPSGFSTPASGKLGVSVVPVPWGTTTAVHTTFTIEVNGIYVGTCSSTGALVACCGARQNCWLSGRVEPSTWGDGSRPGYGTPPDRDPAFLLGSRRAHYAVTYVPSIA